MTIRSALHTVTDGVDVGLPFLIAITLAIRTSRIARLAAVILDLGLTGCGSGLVFAVTEGLRNNLFGRVVVSM